MPDFLVCLARKSVILIAVYALFMPLTAAGSVRYLPDRKLFVLESPKVSYIFGINERSALQHVYWGGKIPDTHLSAAQSPRDYAFESRDGMTNEEYPGWGGMNYVEPCVKATFADGIRDLVLRYASHQIKGDELWVHLKDVNYDLYVTLHYRAYPEHNLLRRHTVIQNRLQQDVTIESAQSAVWYVPAGEGYRLSYLHGRWGGETQLQREAIHPGLKVLESRRGNTSHQMNPWFAIDYNGEAGEEHGRVWFGALGWSGNWRFSVEQTPNRQVRLTGGMNSFDFAYHLAPGESLTTPPFYAGYTDAGFGSASRILHRFQRAEILPLGRAARLRPVLYNSWEATLFDVNEKAQTELAQKAAQIGVEMFVMDDGWFGARDHDRAGLGDWVVNRKKFPQGLKPLIDAVHKAGLQFGLWVEPEMVNPDSDLYRAHPDWVIHFPGRPRTPGRNQLMLNMARDDVKEYVFNMLDRLLTENDIQFFKWDMNRHLSEPGWPGVPIADQRKLYVKYVTNVYEIFDRLRARHPKLEIESCSGGGGRVDLGILERVDQVWTSDNTEAFDRLRIQEGFTQAYTPKTMMAWVTDVPNMNNRSTPLQYRFLVAMQGSLGIGANLNHWSKEDFELATKMIALYKDVRRTVQEGSLYRLASPSEGMLTANQYVSEDGRQSVVFACLQAQQFNYPAPTIYLRGLDPDADYRVRTIDKKLDDPQPILSGAALMNRGLNFRLRGDFDSSAVVLEKVQ